MEATLNDLRNKLLKQEQELNKLRSEVEMFKRVVKEENEQKYQAYKRINELQKQLGQVD